MNTTDSLPNLPADRYRTDDYAELVGERAQRMYDSASEALESGRADTISRAVNLAQGDFAELAGAPRDYSPVYAEYGVVHERTDGGGWPELDHDRVARSVEQMLEHYPHPAEGIAIVIADMTLQSDAEKDVRARLEAEAEADAAGGGELGFGEGYDAVYDTADDALRAIGQMLGEGNPNSALEWAEVLHDVIELAVRTPPEELTPERVEIVHRLASARADAVENWGDRVPDDLDGIDEALQAEQRRRFLDE